MRLSLLVSILLLAAPAAANAATAQVKQLDSCGGDITCTKYMQGTPVAVVDVTAPDGEENRVTVRPEGSSVVVTDKATPLAAGPGCTALDPNSARCPLRGTDADDEVPVFQAALASRDDTLTVDGDLVGRAVLDGGDGADTITGGAERDRLEGGNGADTLDGAGGNDSLDFSTRADGVSVDLAKGEAVEGGASDKLASIESVIGSKGRDTLVGSDGDDLLDGGPGDDRIEGGHGDDALAGSGGKDHIEGGAGDDQIESDRAEDINPGVDPSGADTVSGGAGDDRIVDGGTIKGDRLNGGSGDDLVDAGRAATRIKGGSGRDRLKGSAGKDRIDGGAGNDTIDGYGGGDRIKGGTGKDKLRGGKGVDRIDAKDGEADTIVHGRKDKVRRDDEDRVTR